MTRDEVLETMRRAATLEQIGEAKRIVSEWIQAHPDDWGIRMEAEGLAMLESALRDLGVESAADLQKRRT